MSDTVNIKELNERIERESLFVDTLRMEMGKVIVGQGHLVDTLLIGLLSGGHILLEGVPGLAKTLAITTLAKAVDANFSRIQFTPDLLPADLIGTLIYSQKTEDFFVKKGPIFANFIIADEINRSPAKDQSADPNVEMRWALDAPLEDVDPVLHDLRVDPFERNNVALDPQYRELAEYLRKKLATIVLGDGRIEVDWKAANSYKRSTFALGADDKKLEIPTAIIPKTKK